MNSWFRDEDEQREHLEMLQNQNLWPKSANPHICVKHPERMREPGSVDTAFGVVYPDNFNIHVGHGAIRTLEKYDSAEAIIAAGWVVD